MTDEDFQPLEYFVYVGRTRLGRYRQTTPKMFEAFGSVDRPVGMFPKQKLACAAIAGVHGEVCR